MTWFKVDDGFYDHPKVDGLSNAAVGLWVKAGAWCAKHETDGVIPASRVKALKGTPSQISALIRCGLWVETESESGAKAYSFRNWLDYQPGREERREERAMWREKKRKSRRRKSPEQPEPGNVPEGVPEMSPEETNEGVPEMSGTIPDPTRPDHINKGREEPYGSSENGAQTPPEEFVGSLDELAARQFRREKAPGVYGSPEDPRCADHVALDTAPQCRACARARAWFEENAAAEDERARAARREERARADACPYCEGGWRKGTNPAVRCDHSPEAGDDLPPWEVAQ